MECNGTSIKQRRAFGLVEFLVTLVLSGLLLATIAKVVFYTGRSFAGLANYVELDKYSRNALDQMTSKIRMTDELKEFTTNKLVFSYKVTNSLTYFYSAQDRTLTETLGKSSRTLLKGCDRLTFSVFQRNTAAGTYDQFPATLTNSAAKLIQVSWLCSRDVLSAQFNTESVQSAKIVIRNQ
jgi:Tfp pilus assembly protein PilW